MPTNDLNAITKTQSTSNVSTTADAQKYGFNQCLNSAAAQNMWLCEAEKGLADIAAGRSSDARASILAIQTRRAKEINLLAKINQLD